MLRVESRQFSSTSPAFNIPRLHLAPPLGVILFEFCRDFRYQKTTVRGLSREFVWRCLCDSMCSRFVSIEHRLVKDGRTDGETDTRRQLITALANVARLNHLKNVYVFTDDSCTALLDLAPYKFHTELEAVNIS